MLDPFIIQGKMANLSNFPLCLTNAKKATFAWRPVGGTFLKYFDRVAFNCKANQMAQLLPGAVWGVGRRESAHHTGGGSGHQGCPSATLR